MFAIVLFTWLKQFATNSVLSYPPNMNCLSINSLFDGDELYNEYAHYDKDPTIDQ